MADDVAGQLRWQPDQVLAAARTASPPVPGATCLPLLIQQAVGFCTDAWEIRQGLVLPRLNIVHAIRLSGRLDVSAANSAMRELVTRHDALRVGFPDAGQAGYQVVYPACVAIQFEYRDVSRHQPDEREQLAYQLLREASTRRFDHGGGLLIRGIILTLGELESILLIAADRLTIDGRSFGVLLDDFCELYAAALEGTGPSLGPPESTYSELVWDEVARFGSAERKEALDYWSERLSQMGVAPSVRLPIALRATNESYVGGHSPTALLEGDVMRGLWRACEDEMVTPFTLLVTGLGAVLRRYGGGESFGYWVPVARRDDPARQRLVGPLNSHMIISQDVSGDPTFAELAARTQEEVLESLEYSDMPFTQIAMRIDPSTPGRHRLEPGLWCDISPIATSSRGLAGCSVEPYSRPLQDGPVDMIGLFGVYTRERLRLSLGYPADVYPADAMAGMLGYLTALLGQVARDSSVRLSALYRAVDAAAGALPGLP